jgi:uncharacterized membrane protein
MISLDGSFEDEKINEIRERCHREVRQLYVFSLQICVLVLLISSEVR